jgi:hypothetical protein
METLTEANPNARELITEVLDEILLWRALKVVSEFLRAKNVQMVRIEFGFVVSRDLAGKKQGCDQILQIAELEGFMNKAIEEGTIETMGTSDFLFYPLDSDLTFMLCNDGDLHFASTTPSLLAELVQSLRTSEIEVYDSGRLI